eukprot:superscaffoldBa00000890_g7846
MAPPVIETCHVACCANRTPNVVSWSRGWTIAFGTCNSVALYDPQERRVVTVLNGHTGRVNAVQWVHREDCACNVSHYLHTICGVHVCSTFGVTHVTAPESHLVSGGSDNRLIVWEAQNGKFIQSVECKGHTGPICAVDAIYVDYPKILVASSASDSTIRLWLCSDAKDAECLHTLSFGSGFMMDVSLALLPGSRVPILSCGGDDSRVHLYVQSDKQLKKAMTLQGHEDWVRGVAWASRGGELLLASCSQDCLIRVWRLCAKSGTDARTEDDHTIIKMKEDVFEVKERDVSSSFAVSLETVLAGHENWVYGVHWQPAFYKACGSKWIGSHAKLGDIVSLSLFCGAIAYKCQQTVTISKKKENAGSELQQPLSLLSASMDKTMILWAPEEGSGVWVEQVRVGEVGGNTLGFYGCQMSPDGSMIIAHAFHGALHLWCQDQDKEGEWRPGVVISGHFDAVQDLSWDPEGDFILSVGSDQTTRLFTPWRKQDGKKATWHEISRPQIHGYDMQCLAMVGRFQFVSGADEKVLRVFQAPRNFVENFANISGVSREKLLTSSSVYDLSLYDCSPSVSSRYGHGFEMFCLASDSARTVVASACKASKAEHASVLLWSTSTWRQVQTLPCHTLTVTQMAFSPDAQLLLAVSRDRTWSLWRRNPSTPDSPEPQFSLHAHTGKDTAIHSRIIWSCDWSSDSKYFVTSSRDKKVIVWGPYLIAVGLECGKIMLYRWSPGQETAGGHDWGSCAETDTSQSHSLAVKRLVWRPRAGRAGREKDGQTDRENELEEESSWVQLASASADHSVKIFNINKLAL